MKRILTIISVFMLLFVCSISASADEVVPKYWSLNVPIKDMQTFTLTSTNWTSTYGSGSSGTKIRTYIEGNYYCIGMYGSNSTSTPNFTSKFELSSGELWEHDGYFAYFKHLYFPDLEANSSLHLWLKANGTPKACDGTSCPATDMNMDNICDDCGMMFAVLRDYTLPDVYTGWTDARQEFYHYAFIYYDLDGAPTLIISSSKPYYNDVIGSVVVESNHVKFNVYGDSWRLTNSYDNGATFVTDSVIPSFNMLTSNGNPAFSHDTEVFPIPLWQMIQGATQGEMEMEAVKITQTMGLLAVCGVGLIALLVSLVLLSKRSLLFLKR